MRPHRMEVVKRLRPPLPPWHGFRHRAAGYSSGGCPDGLPVAWCLYFFISRHLHQCKLTLVVYQWQVGIFEEYNGRFPNRTLYLQNIPTCHSSASPGESLISGSLLDDGIRNTKRGWSPGDSLNLVRVLSVRVNYSQQCRNDINGRWEYSVSIMSY